MNRRSFLKDMLKAGVACTFLPGAGRIWKPTYQTLDLVPFMDQLHNLRQQQRLGFWYEETFGSSYYSPEYLDYMRQTLKERMDILQFSPS